LIKQNTIASQELVKQINLFRDNDGNRSEIQHYDLLKIISDEFEEEIGLLNSKESSYKNSQNKEQPMFILTISQAKQILVRESKFVRKAVISYFEVLQENLNIKNSRY
jgi:phage regulator Rha-like protein